MYFSKTYIIIRKKTLKKDKIYALESLRGLAAISVAIFHLDINSHFKKIFFPNSWILVDFFFVLSGFVISLNYIERIPSLKKLFQFQRKRFLRLYPLHLFTLILFLSWEIAELFGSSIFGFSLNSSPFEKNNINALISNIFLLQSWTSNQATFNYPSWSISAEFVTYGIFGILILLSKNNRKLIIIFLMISISALGLALSKTSFDIGSLRCLYSFSIGALTHLIYEKQKKSHSNLSSLPLTFSIFLNILLIIFFGTKEFNYLILFPILFAITIFIVAITPRNKLINKLLINRFLVYCGSLSYSIYMLHAFVWRIIQIFLKLFVGAFTKTGFQTNNFVLEELNIYFGDVLTIISIFILIILSHYSFQIIEKKFYKILT